MTNSTEYMVHIWGGAWNSDANPSIEKDLGITEGYHYFSTKEERDAFIAKLKNPIYKSQGIMIDCTEGVLSHKRTVFIGVFSYAGEDFIVHYDLGYEYPEEDAVYYFTYGNFSCDCNRSMLIRAQHGNDAIPNLMCGWDIELKDYQMVYLD